MRAKGLIKSTLIQIAKALLLFSALALSGCTGSILEEPILAELASSKGSNGIEYDEYIPPGIQFVESTSQGMSQEGFPYLRKNRVFNIKWIIKTCSSEADIANGVCSGLSSNQIENPDPGFYISRIDYTPDGGATWSTISGAENLGGYNDQIQTFSWSIPDSLSQEGENFKFRLRTRNAQGSEFTVTSNLFTMDSSAPAITRDSLKFNNSLESPLILKSPGVSIDFQATDSLSPIESFCIKNSAAPPSSNDACWIKLTNMGFSESKNTNITKLKRTLGWFGGSFAYYFWVRDKAGNPSILTNEIGDTAVDFRTISYSPGKSISFSKVLAANKDNVATTPEVIDTLVNASNSSIYLKWNFFLDSSATLDETEPYQIHYSLNGIDFFPIVNSSGTTISGADLFSNIDQGCSPLSTSESLTLTKCYKWDVPASLFGLPIYVRINVKDSAGFVYTMSTNPLNLNVSAISANLGLGLRFVAGASDSLIGGSALNTKFSIGQNEEGGKLAVHEDGRIFLLDSTYGVIVISPIDGRATIYIKLGTSTDGVAVDNTSLLKAGEVEGKSKDLQKISLDYKGRLLLFENTKIRMVTDEYDTDGNLTGRRTLKTIIGCMTSPCYYDNNEKNTALSAKTPKEYWQNAWIYANEFNFKGIVRYENTLFRHFTPTPNGDIYFTVNTWQKVDSTVKPSSSNSYQGLDIRIYRPDPDPTKPGKIYPLRLTGFGVFGEPFRPISELYPSSLGGLVFNPTTGTPTTFHMIWEVCPSNPNLNCAFYTSNHNPKTGASNGTGTQYYSIPMSLNASLTANPGRWSGGYRARFITSRRGELYAFDRGNFSGPSLYKLNTSTNKFVRILGHWSSGYCPDGTLATNCPNRITDAWITQDDTVFFIDSYQLRMIGKDGKVTTLFGRKTADGNGKDAMLSTLGTIDSFDIWRSGQDPLKFIVKEHENIVLREFSMAGNISVIAGNETSDWGISFSKASSLKPGYYVSSTTALEKGAWHGSHYIIPPVIANPKTGEVITNSPDSESIMKLIRQENANVNDRGRWLRLLGGGSASTPFFSTKGAGSCDGKFNNQCRNDFNGSNKVVAFIPEKALTPDGNGNPRTRPSQILTLNNRYNTSIGKWEKYFLKLIDTETGLMTHFSGDGATTYDSYRIEFPDSYSGVEMANSSLLPFAYDALKYTYDPSRDAIIVGMQWKYRIGFIEIKSDANEQIVSAGKYYNLTSTAGPLGAFTHKNINSKDVIYYCNISTGRLQRKVVTTASSSEINIPLPSGITCNTSARSMESIYDSELDIIKVYFSVRVNGQTTIGEYVDRL